MASKTNGNTQILWPDDTSLQSKRFGNAGGFGYADFPGDVNARVYPTYAEFVRNGDILTVSAPVGLGNYQNFYDFNTGKIHSDVLDVSSFTGFNFTSYKVSNAANGTEYTADDTTNKLTLLNTNLTYDDLNDQDMVILKTTSSRPGGLINPDATFYIKKISGSDIKLFANIADFQSNTPIDITTTGGGTQTLYRASVRGTSTPVLINDKIYIDSLFNGDSSKSEPGYILPLAENIFDKYMFDVTFAIATNAYYVRCSIPSSDFPTVKFAHSAVVQELSIQVQNSVVGINDGVNGYFFITVTFLYNANKWYVLNVSKDIA
jgi:hypothetical protein